MKANAPKHNAGYPTARKIRRACSNELYRTVKRMKVWVPKDKMDQAETIYFKKVILQLTWIYENKNNRKIQADWWDENVSAEIAELWDVDRAHLCAAFREAYGG
ncbi:dehydrogenase [Paenibacillus sp. FSL H8-0548]|uniref:dehydrogenase n=1 Tax=Paenibacillus sp. FSL H8-0548 TaxID=1920422 RepID=UPI00096E1AD9|nr:dehydrogenase [Paenibacillus sp. FSL H8-0548]OMF30840.1 dehydrogenase [Paenibacillus sp. FSL H8-0548]